MTEGADIRQTLPYLLGAMIYYDAQPKSDRGIQAKSFEKISADARKPFIDQATMFLTYLGKLNFVVITKDHFLDLQKPQVPDSQRIEDLSNFIMGFVRELKNFKPDLFPSLELATRIVRAKVGQ